MKNRKWLLLIFAAIGAWLTVSQAASAHTVWNDNGNWVTMTRDVKVLKIHNTVPRYKSYQVASYTAKKGSHYKLEHWGVEHSWVLNSGKFNSNDRYTYVVSAGSMSTSWFKFGIHKIAHTSKYKSFHGYRIARAKSDLTFNTFYIKFTHDIVSDYAPTQTSKVIFKHGSHVYPKRHEWDKIVGDYVTSYTYKSGAWHKGDTMYVPD